MLGDNEAIPLNILRKTNSILKLYAQTLNWMGRRIIKILSRYIRPEIYTFLATQEATRRLVSAKQGKIIHRMLERRWGEWMHEKDERNFHDLGERDCGQTVAHWA